MVLYRNRANVINILFDKIISVWNDETHRFTHINYEQTDLFNKLKKLK